MLMEEEGYIVLTYARDEDNNEMDYITIRRTHSVIQRGGGGGGDIMQLRGQRLCYESCRVWKEFMKQCLNDFQAAGHVRIFQFDSFIGSTFLI